MIDEKVLIERLEERIRMNEMFRNSIINNGIVVALGIINDLAEEHNNGWISVEDALPEDEGKSYIVQKTNGFVDILGFAKDAYKLSKYDFPEYKGKKKPIFYDWDSEYGYCEWECEAWQPLPAPYRKGE